MPTPARAGVGGRSATPAVAAGPLPSLAGEDGVAGVAGAADPLHPNYDDLTVLPDEMPPYPATIQQPVSQMRVGQLRPGLTFEASVDRSNPAAILLDLTTLR